MAFNTKTTDSTVKETIEEKPQFQSLARLSTMLKFKTEECSYKPDEGIVLPIQFAPDQLVMTKNIHHIKKIFMVEIKKVVINAFAEN